MILNSGEKHIHFFHLSRTMEKEQIFGDLKPTEAWTEDLWDP